MTEDAFWIAYEASYHKFVDYLLARVPSTNGKRAYAQTFVAWLAWCEDHKVNPLNLDDIEVSAYLVSKQVSYNTRRRHLSALRSLARTIAEANPTTQLFQDRLQKLKGLTVPKQNLIPSKHQLHELSPRQANIAMDVWMDETLLHLRNRAIIALLLTTGIRRAEINRIGRDQINLQDGTIFVPHSENPRFDRTIAVPSDPTLSILAAWLDVLGNRQFVFPAFHRSGQTKPVDKPMSDQAIYNIVRQTQELSGLHFTPRDARRTFIVETVERSPFLDVQEQVGHKAVSSTLAYVKSAKRKPHLRLRYGNNKR